MARFVNVPDGDYTIKVTPGGYITLNTGSDEGWVRITGNLIVEGTTTTVDTANMTIEDNIIVLNKGESGSGITDASGTSGIQIDRGTASDAYTVFDEDADYTKAGPSPSTTISQGKGAWVFKYDSGELAGIKTNSINTAGGNLYLINSSTGVVSVQGTNAYESRVVHDDHMPNKKYVDDAISTAFATVFLSQIGDGTVDISSIIIRDNETTGVESVIDFAIDGVTVSQLYRDRWEFEEIRISNTTIETINTGDSDLILRAWGDGSVRIEDTLLINKIATGFTPSVPADGVKIYTTNEYSGKTGIYFVNEDQTRDELVSKNRSLLFSMIF